MVVGEGGRGASSNNMYVGPEWAQNLDPSVFRAINKNN
jgi:hypothetical protein